MKNIVREWLFHRKRLVKGSLMTALTLVLAAVVFAGCSDNGSTETKNSDPTSSQSEVNGTENTTPNSNTDSGDGKVDGEVEGEGNSDSAVNQSNSPDKSAAADANSVAVLVNKEFALPEDHVPTDLVYPDVRFTFKEKIEKRMMRSEAAAALEKLFAGAEEDGIYLAGVSAYRSHSTQTSLFNRYVAKDGEEKAKTYSAVPGHSEHETGLSIDVSGSDGKCAAEDCFGDTKEAKWLAEHVGEYGYIIRYPEGKESITGYKYEPWHLRYVGVEIATYIVDNNITLEEYYNAVPVMANP
ncbi:D-Ala-D-Ala carboxypeptidase. Metallo peptidase. MEROPS family M15B [Fontibacillus panacisegetis]|uniref:D-Ala-D-Ala carboxypeptidase. Metallo peptidase. MEROPS family M15B n=1 Tax=Fontibacillus panacisegetis TaxID=670482 RepID=A0A1G7U5H3_9BACL|nr:M15 family metallopeptidase [Fontibacillus panacisegetis]SDG42511.1 D-Ala-D-Ala carboxypeptidase. Metallo peptidase. MEROPS family M15B [Fontibacillus panacisegetis]